MISKQEALKRINVTHGSFISSTDVEAWGCFVTDDMSWDGRLNQRILNVAGEEFDEYTLDNVIQPKSGNVYCLPAFSAPVDRIFLGILPKWRDGLFDEEKLLTHCYKNLMAGLAEHETESISIPALGSGQRSFPRRRVARLIMNIIIQNMPETLKTIKIVCKDDLSFGAYKERL